MWNIISQYLNTQLNEMSMGHLGKMVANTTGSVGSIANQAENSTNIILMKNCHITF